MKKRKVTTCAYCGQPTRTLVEAGKIRKYLCLDEACWVRYYEEVDSK